MSATTKCACGCGATFPARKGKRYASKACCDGAWRRFERGGAGPRPLGYRECDDREARDAEIRRLRAEGLSYYAIAARTGWSRALVNEVCNPAAKARANERRRKHMAARSAA